MTHSWNNIRFQWSYILQVEFDRRACKKLCSSNFGIERSSWRQASVIASGKSHHEKSLAVDLRWNMPGMRYKIIKFVPLSLRCFHRNTNRFKFSLIILFFGPWNSITIYVNIFINRLVYRIVCDQCGWETVTRGCINSV